MNIKYNMDELKHIITDLSCLTGMSFSIVNNDFKHLIMCCRNDDYCSILQKSKVTGEYCHCSDMELLSKCKESRKLESHICHSGLCDSAMPIIKNGIIAGYIFFGRIRNENSPENQIYDDLMEKEKILNEKYKELAFLSHKQIEAFYDLLPRILFQNAIEIEDDGFISKISEYIKNNLADDLQISSLCKYFFVSKKRLYEAFNNYYGCTVNEYIIGQRMEKAKNMLENSNEPIYVIAEAVGYYNYTYFCKIFKRKTGLNPSQYRRIVRNKEKNMGL